MLTNAVLLRIDVLTPSAIGGESDHVAGEAIRLRCLLRQDDADEAYKDNARLTETRKMILRVLSRDLALADAAITTTDHVTVQGDDESEPGVYWVDSVERCPKGSLSFLEAHLTSE